MKEKNKLLVNSRHNCFISENSISKRHNKLIAFTSLSMDHENNSELYCQNVNNFQPGWEIGVAHNTSHRTTLLQKYLQADEEQC